MAFAVLRALASRLEREGRLAGPLSSAFLGPGGEELNVRTAISLNGRRCANCVPLPETC